MPATPTLPPIADKPLSVVLLARDDADHVEAVVNEWAGFLAARGAGNELLLVDDASNDGTADRAEALRERLPGLRVLRHPQWRGEGVALRTGLEAATCPLVFYTLCRPEYPPADLTRLLSRAPAHEDQGREVDHVHIMSGYRAGRRTPWPLGLVGRLWWLFCVVALAFGPAPLAGWLGWRRHLGWLVVRVLFGLRYHDVACPFRLLRRDVLARIPIQSRGPFAHVELLAKANFLGLVLGEEMPIDVVPPPYRGDWAQWRRDALLVFNHPDFGPAVLPGAVVEPPG
jgi:glycosyltransferase involved in cell wall biosynthesis